MASPHDTLKAERDELLTALKRAEAFIRITSGGGETEFRETILLPVIRRAESRPRT